ncbi:hypothetical protein BN7_4397 [Wickerhamomyces ciferrii]|uniref:Uncharacterized protein n=1 Tax=Wickerhamomyces ciferrii (strain ATCC 14091 / BCRC 22168 / CBS 111 / JCM 3599 / NBRC 0793 / NRRL Y-1031 F-60-10) TaxID=1206466 RepID=K0KUF9_WICCF|nr:uncharacterized protein BN7_4397 [Wickerhamomyces ciferrii]CCH44828.1 hypothetical protein BN7_4397 [Wickerhamomyces ciferrii]
MSNKLTATQRKGYNTILNLTDEELIGTLRLEPVKTKKNSTTGTMYKNCQSERFVAALCDPRTSYEFKSKEIFEIVEPQNVEYKKFTIKLTLKSHPTSALSKDDIKNIKAYIDWCEKQHHLEIFMQPDLNISDVTSYLNKVGSLKSDKEIDDDVSKINLERIPRVFIRIKTPEFFRCFHQLLNIYSNSLLNSSHYAQFKLIGKVFQRQRSNFISIEGTIPHRNCAYFFKPSKSSSKYLINSEYLKTYSSTFKKTDLGISSSNLQKKFYSIYDMDCPNDKINIKKNADKLPEEDSLPPFSNIE